MTTKLTTSNLSAETLTAISGPRISNVKIADSSYTVLDDTAANISGGFIIINGQNFISNCQVLIDNTPATTVTFVSNSVIRAQVPASAEGTTKSIYVVNPDGSSAIIINGLTYSAFPAWSTGSTLTSFEALVPVSIQLSAPSATVYTLAAANTLPSSLSLYANGLIAGTVAANTTTNYNFTVNAKDAENQDTNRNFTLPITQNIEPAWVTAADLGSAFVDANYSNTLVATDLSNVTYSVAAGSSLPSTLTLAANGFLSGSVSAANTYSFGIVATDTANLSNTRTFSITIDVANDTYFKNTTLLLNGETTVTPFISDASTNSFPLTINGDTKPVLFNPYTPGYYSNYFDGTGDYLSFPNNGAFAFGTGSFTIEFWINAPLSNDKFILSGRAGISSLIITTGGYNGTTTAGALRYGSTDIGTSVVVCDNTWHHCAIVRDGSSAVTMYVDGVSRATTTDSTNYTTTAGIWYIATNDSGPPQNVLTGYISNLRIIKGTAVYTTAFTPPTTPLTAIANTSLLTCQSNRLIDNSTNAFAITKSGDVTVSSAIPFTASSSYSTYGSTYFDGTGDYLRIPNNAALQFGSGNWTVEFWAYLSTIGTYRSFFSKVNDDGYFNGVCILTNASGDLIITATNNGAAWQLAGATLYAGALTTGRWQHIAIVRNSNTITGYVNGVAGGTPQTLSGTVNDTGASFFIGSSNGVSAGQKMDGYISDFRFVKGTAVYTTAFTPPTTPLTAIANTSLLTLQYNGGANNSSIIDNSNFNNIITRNGNTSQGTFSPYSVTGWSNYFNGTSDYWTVGSNTAFQFGTGDFTIECWVYPIPNGLNYPTFLSSVTGWSAGASSHRFNNTGYANKFWFGLNGSGGVASGDPFMASTNTFTPNSWYHYALTRSGNTWRMFVNGALENTQTYSGSYDAGYGGLRAGRATWNGAAGYFTGYTSNLRIIKGTAIYTAGFTAPTSPLTAITNTSLLTCQSNRLIDNSTNNLTITKGGDVSVQALSPFGSVPEAVPISYSNFFDGTGDYFYSSASSANAMGTGDYTVEAWIYVTAAFGTTGSGRGAIISNRGQESATNAFMLQHYNGTIYFGTSDTDVIVGSTTMVTNTWYHVVVSRSSGTVRLFLNGVSDATAVTGNSTNHSATNAFYVGIDGAYDRYPFTGYISNARLVKGTAVYTTTFTPSTTPLTAIANTSLLTCQSTRMIDNSTNAFTITASGDTKPRIFNPFGYTTQSTTSYTPSIHGGSAYFDGTTDYLTAASTSVFGYGTGDFTIEFWFNPNSTGLQTVFSHLTSVISINPHIYVDTTIRYFTNNGVRITGSTLSIGQWHHIALCRASGSTRLFINGTQSGTTYSDSNNYGTTAPLGIGTYWSSGSPVTTNTVNGYLSDIRVTKGTAIYTSNFVPPTQTLGNYSTTNPASLLLNFNNGGIIDQHGTNVLETLGNTQLSTAVKKYGNASMYFDGTGDYLTTTTNAVFTFGTGDFTIEMWLYVTANPDNYAYFYAQGPITSASMCLYLQAGKIKVWNGSNIIVGSTTYSLNTWYHVALSRTGTSLKLFLDGVQDGSATNSSNITTGSTYGPTIARWVEIGDNNYFAGYIDDLRITKGYARYTTTFTPPTTALITK